MKPCRNTRLRGNKDSKEGCADPRRPQVEAGHAHLLKLQFCPAQAVVCKYPVDVSAGAKTSLQTERYATPDCGTVRIPCTQEMQVEHRVLRWANPSAQRRKEDEGGQGDPKEKHSSLGGER